MTICSGELRLAAEMGAQTCFPLRLGAKFDDLRRGEAKNGGHGAYAFGHGLLHKAAAELQSLDGVCEAEHAGSDSSRIFTE